MPSSTPPASTPTSPSVQEEFRALRLSLSGRDSYRDFRYLLGELIGLVSETSTSSGYGQ